MVTSSVAPAVHRKFARVFDSFQLVSLQAEFNQVEPVVSNTVMLVLYHEAGKINNIPEGLIGIPE